MIPITVATFEVDGLSVRKLDTAMREVNYAAAEHWHANQFSEDHFKENWRNRAHLRRRTAKYIARKKRDAMTGRIPSGNANTDNVYTGTMRDLMTDESLTLIKATPNKATVTMQTPRHAHIKRAFVRPVDEVLKTLRMEEKQLARVQRDVMDSELNKLVK